MMQSTKAVDTVTRLIDICERLNNSIILLDKICQTQQEKLNAQQKQISALAARLESIERNNATRAQD